jgi:hypothetical protein
MKIVEKDLKGFKLWFNSTTLSSPVSTWHTWEETLEDMSALNPIVSRSSVLHEESSVKILVVFSRVSHDCMTCVMPNRGRHGQTSCKYRFHIRKKG